MAGTKQQSAEPKYKFRLNGEPVTEIPPDALEKMAERLSRVVSEHFSQHPDQYEAFLRSREEQQQKMPT